MKLGTLPTLEQQRSKGRILSAYDDLIENNRRQIALLEEAARLLYLEWFVHFRFPGHEHGKITNSIPDGWERQTLARLASLHLACLSFLPQDKRLNKL